MEAVSAAACWIRARALLRVPLGLLLACVSCAVPGAVGPGTRPAPGSDPDFGPLVFTSEDGANELVVEGLLQMTATFLPDGRRPAGLGRLKRLRPEFSGRIADVIRFHLEPKLKTDDFDYEEAWLGTTLFDERAILMLGRMKAPFNLEEVRSRTHIDFPRFSVLNQLAPMEDHGVFLNGTSASGRWEYGLAAYNGTGDSDTTSSRDVAARLMLHPFVGDEESVLRNLQVGIAATGGRQDRSVGGNSIENEIGLGVVSFAPGVRLDGSRWRAGLEGAWFHGPWFVQTEYIVMQQEMSLAGSDTDIDFEGGYVTLSRVLTGEDKTFKGVVPRDPFDPRTGTGTGAWVAALRLSSLHIDRDLMTAGLAAPGAFTDHIRNVSLGLNWIPNTHTIVRTSVVHSMYDRPIATAGGTDDRESALMVEVQFHF
jgi:phosphate-selective porin OprO/OprP